MVNMSDCIIPDWPVPSNVKTLFTTRKGGVSRGHNDTYASLNLGDHVHDNLSDVQHNRTLLQQMLPASPKWLKQVHGVLPIWMDGNVSVLEGDAALSCQRGSVCAVLVADCLPVFLCDDAGTVVGVVHAGWRGLAAGIIERSVAAMRDKCNGNIMAWLGPAIGPNHFEIGAEVREIFVNHNQKAVSAFVSRSEGNKWLADLFFIARQRLAEVGVSKVYGGDVCTFSDPVRFFSYRRDGETGRMAALIWLEIP